MKLTPIGPFQLHEAKPEVEPFKPEVKTEAVTPVNPSQIETQAQTGKERRQATIVNILDEAKKRAEARKRIGLTKLKARVLEAYARVRDFEERVLEIGPALDKRV